MTKKKEKGAGFVIIWEFRVTYGKRHEFEKVYGPEGEWVKFFRSGKGYVRTELIRDRGTARRYLTLDYWISREAFLVFKKRNRVEYQAIDEKCVSLTQNEVKIGEFRGVAGQRRWRP